MNILQRILDYSYHARDKRALDPETGEPIPDAKAPSMAVKVGAAMVNSSWAKRNLLKYVYMITGPVSAWLAAHGGGENTAAIVAGVIAVVTFLFDRLASWLNEQATMKIPPAIGAPTAAQEKESIEAWEARPSIFKPLAPTTTTSGTGTSVTVNALAPTQRIGLPTQEELNATRAKLYGFSVEVDGEVHDFLDKLAAINFRNAARADGKRANLLF